MILYQDNLFVLEYEVNSDILYVMWPSLTPAQIPAVQVAIGALTDAINHYDVKKLLIDSSKSRVDIADDVYRPLVFGLITQLQSTRLQRMARVMPENTFREASLQSYNQEMKANNMFTFETGEFETKAKALDWLKA